MTISVHAKAVVEVLTAKGFHVTYRFTKHGSPRFTVDGSREMDAHTMTKRYWAHL
jgi:hypothetical protein